MQLDITGPAGSGTFGEAVTVLPNGNIVITDRNYGIPGGAAQVGAAYLYDGTTLAMISMLTGSTAGDQVGSGGVTALTNGNYVVRSTNWTNPSTGAASAGAVTFGSAATGVGGVVSSTNSLVGATENDSVGSSGVVALTGGNYVVRSSNWTNPATGAANAGAVTFGSGAAGTAGTVSAANSLVGSTASDTVGSGGVTVLNNGNYVVISPNWDNLSPAAIDAGAVTFGNGTSGTSGTVSAANSLVGTTESDQVGVNSGGLTTGVIVLTNSNYVVLSRNWDNPATGVVNAGAVTFGSGTAGVRGPISASNSLVGTTDSDQVGIIGGVTALTNGNYVVRTPSWDNPATGLANVGAVTFANGTNGISGTISPANSLVGTTAGDQVGNTAPTALANGNYVVRSTVWDNPETGTIDVGAATFAGGTSGLTGTISSSNSLIGTTAADNVGSGAVIALTNGNYVVCSSGWDNPATGVANVGAATFANGTTGLTGQVTSANSLTGTLSGDRVGETGVALTNGNYVVRTSSWQNPQTNAVGAGAVTFGNGTTGITGTVSAANSLIGSTVGDNVGISGIFVLPNGNYVVDTQRWNNFATGTPAVGAVTFGNGTIGTSGVVSEANSLVGTVSEDAVGGNGVTVLPNGNYVVKSPVWDNPAAGLDNVGAATLASGTTGLAGQVTPANSLIGSTSGDLLGGTVTALSNGNYQVDAAVWDNPFNGASNAGAVSFGNGMSGTSGPVTDGAAGGNSIVGAVTGGTSTFGLTISAFDLTRNRLLVGRSANNAVSILFFNTTAVADGAISSPATFNNGLPDALKTAIIPNGRTVALSGVSKIGQVQVDCTGALTGASAANYIAGTVRKNFCGATGAGFVYPIGDADNYSPLIVANTSGTGSLTAGVTDNFLTGLPAATSVSRYWTLEGAGISTDLTFQYTPADVNGPEPTYKLFRRKLNLNQQFASTVNPLNHTITAKGVSTFSDWGIGATPLGPTAAGITIGGRVTNNKGQPIASAVITLTDLQGVKRTVTTSAFGYYSFSDVRAGQIYLVAPAAKRYTFGHAQTVSASADVAGLDFIAD